jgi:hypothetical protein
MPSRFQDMLRTQRQNPETSRAGLKWEEAEDDQLLTMISDGTSQADIAKTLQRTEGSIKTRLIVYALGKMEKDNLSLQQVAELVNLSEKDITDYQERKTQRDEKKQQKSQRTRTSANMPGTTYSNRPANVTNADIYDLLLSMNKTLTKILKPTSSR